METIALDYAPPPDPQNRRPITWLESAVLAAAGIFLPMLCFAASLNLYPGGPVYQRGQWLDYLTILPSVRASYPFAPLLFAATFAMAVLVIAPHRVAQSWLLRWALYSGAILSAQYTLIQALAVAEPAKLLSLATFAALVAAVIVTFLALALLWALPRLSPLPRIKLAYWLPFTILIPVAAAVLFWRITLPLIVISTIFVAIVAPALTLAAYLRVSFIVSKLAQQQPPPARRIRLRIPLIWLTTYAAAWTLAFINAIDLYNSLPKTPPDC